MGLFQINHFHRCYIPKFRDPALSVCTLQAKLTTADQIGRILLQILGTAILFLFAEKVLLVAF